MTPFLIVLHVLVCVFLILFVLLQPGARGGVGAAFGGAGGQTVFGGRGANTFLAKLTAVAAIIFMLTSISLSYFVSRSGSVMSSRSTPAATDQPQGAPADAAPGSGAAADGTKAADPLPPAAVNPADGPPATPAAPTASPPAEKPIGDPPPAP